MSAKGSFESGRAEGAALPERLERVTFFYDLPDRPGSGLAAAQALVALEAALSTDGTRSVPLAAVLEGHEGGAAVASEEPGEVLIPATWVEGIGLDGCIEDVGPVGPQAGGPLRLTHPDGRISEWA